MSERRGRRYADLFGRLAREGEGAFIPFAMIGDPNPGQSGERIRAMVTAGADALELGLPFSDPIADGPVIQAAATRALAAGVRRNDCWAIIRELRAEYPELPIGLLVYCNLVCHQTPDSFYRTAREAGVDSVLIADLPVAESEPIVRSARNHGIAPVFIAPPNAGEAQLKAIAATSEGYTYVTSREGVTGADDRLRRDQSALIHRLRALGAPPPMLGFGISNPAQVQTAMRMGAAGVIAGSAVVTRAAEGGDLRSLIHELKNATRRTATGMGNR